MILILCGGVCCGIPCIRRCQKAVINCGGVNFVWERRKRVEAEKKETNFDLTSFFPRIAGSDVLIQCLFTTAHSLSNQTLHSINKILSWLIKPNLMKIMHCYNFAHEKAIIQTYAF